MVDDTQHPTKFDCPYCGVRAGSPCVRKTSGSPYPANWYHDARRDYRDGWIRGFRTGVRHATLAVECVVPPPHGQRPQRALRAVGE